MTTRPLATLRAIALGHAPQVLQGRGWALVALAVTPAVLGCLGQALARASDPRLALHLFHQALAPMIVPIMALAAAPGGIREDLERRTLPLVLVRPVPVWILPLAKGLVWYAWGAAWLAAGALGLVAVGAEPAAAVLQALALVLAFWAELAFMNLLGLLFQRGTLWGAVILFGWESLLRVLPAALQRFTFLHQVESIAGSRGGAVSGYEVLAQTQIASAPWAAAAALVLFGALCWALCGWKLQATPAGLAGREAEG